MRFKLEADWDGVVMLASGRSGLALTGAAGKTELNATAATVIRISLRY